MIALSFLNRLLSLIFVEQAHAQGLGGVVTRVGAGLLPSFTGAGWGGGIEGIAGGVVAAIWGIILPTGIFLVVRAGFSLVVSEDEGKLATAKRTISATLIGIMLIYISQELVKAFYTEGILNAAGAGRLNATVYGLANWFLVAMAALGVLMIIVSVIRAIGSFGKEEEVTNMRQTIFGIASGVLMISLLPAIKLTLGVVDLQPLGEMGGGGDATAIITSVTVIISNLLSFLALIAVAIVIYAGVRMIVNFGNDDEYKSSKDLIIRALIGLLIIILSYTIINFILSVMGGGNTVS